MALFTTVNPDTNKERLWGTVVPYANHSYPVFISANNRGGQVTVSQITSSVFPLSHREQGMIAYQESNSTHYKLNSSNQWKALGSTVSNGLFEYTKSTDSNGTSIEMYKWDEGRLEYFIQYASRALPNARYEFWTVDFPRCYFPQKYLSASDANARSTAIRTSGGAGGICWGDTYQVTDSYVLPRAMTTLSTSQASMHVFIDGRWK